MIDLEYMVQELSIDLSVLCLPQNTSVRWQGKESNFLGELGSAFIEKFHSKQERKSFAAFQKSVKKSLAYVNINMCRDFSRRARRYMPTYHHYTLEGDGSTMGFDNNKRLLKVYNPIVTQTFLMGSTLCKCFARARVL